MRNFKSKSGRGVAGFFAGRVHGKTEAKVKIRRSREDRMGIGRLLIGVTIAMTVSSENSPQAFAQDARAVLAPTGRLRAGVYPGSPTSMVHHANTGETHGLGFDLGNELARRLGVPFEQINHQRIADVLEGMKAGAVDFTISNATPTRALDVAFSQTLISLELGYLVSATSPIAKASDVDRPGMRIGVSQGSTSERTLPKLLANAKVVPAPNLAAAIRMLEQGELDAFATNKPTLFEMSDQMKHARVLDGRWGEEHIAVAIPKGRDSAMEYVRHFVEEVQSNGFLARAVVQAGLRGAIEAK
jgi:polar amino acid transport system substrate-binding protein